MTGDSPSVSAPAPAEETAGGPIDRLSRPRLFCIRASLFLVLPRLPPERPPEASGAGWVVAVDGGVPLSGGSLGPGAVSARAQGGLTLTSPSNFAVSRERVLVWDMVRAPAQPSELGPGEALVPGPLPTPVSPPAFF